MRKAWIENNQIRDICHGNPVELYHPDVAKFYTVDVPDDAVNGDGWVDGQLVKPEPPAPVTPVEPEVVPPKVSAIEFKMLFTSAERIAAKTARATDMILDDFWGLLDDPRTQNVDMALTSVQQAIEYTLTVAGVADVAARKAEILTGVVK